MYQRFVLKGLLLFIGITFLSINSAYTQTCATSGTISTSCSTSGNLITTGDLQTNGTGIKMTIGDVSSTTGTFRANGHDVLISSGDSLIIGRNLGTRKGATFTIEPGAYVYAQGIANVGAPNGSSIATINIDGTLEINGDFNMNNAGSVVTGIGSLYVTGEIDNTVGATFEFDTIGGCYPCESESSLPVELTSFGADIVYYVVQLKWSTGSELNNEAFQIERSRDGFLYEIVGRVAGNGTTALPNDYKFTNDHNNKSYYYRLRQIDYDGQFEFSSVVYVEVDPIADIKVGPNPTVSYVHIQGDTESTYVTSVTNLRGEVVVASGSRNLKELEDLLNTRLQQLEEGMYFISLISSSSMSTIPLVKH